MSETITYGSVKFIRHTETYEIRKNQTGAIQYYTKIDTGLKLQLVEKNEAIRQLEYKPIYEKTHQAHLYAQWGGIREFHVGSPYPGRIDLVTDQMVVEVKRVANFEIAFGQLLRYRAQLEGCLTVTHKL